MDLLTTIEATAVALNIVYVVLAIRQNVLCWPFGIAASLISIWFFIEIKLFAEPMLFVYYVLMGVYGWWVWSSKRQQDGSTISVLTIPKHLLLIAAGALLAVLLGFFLAENTSAESPYFDSFTTIFSFVATWLTARKVLENWVYWIVVDVATIFLYGSKGAMLYAGLSVIYTVMAVYGLREWRRSYQSQIPA